MLTHPLPLILDAAPIRMGARWLTIAAYGIGDAVLIWDEPASLVFFGIGHAAFVVAASGKDLIPGVTQTVCYHLRFDSCAEPNWQVMHWVGISHVSATMLAGAVLVLWVLRNGWKGVIGYALYMYTLAMALFVGLCYGHHGVLLFVVSDIIIGFRIDVLHWLSYPLYYTSLILFVAKDMN